MAHASSMGAYLLQGGAFPRAPVLLQVCSCLLCRPLLCCKLACLGSSKLALQAGHQLLQHANSPCRRSSLSVPGQTLFLAVIASNFYIRQVTCRKPKPAASLRAYCLDRASQCRGAICSPIAVSSLRPHFSHTFLHRCRLKSLAGHHLLLRLLQVDSSCLLGALRICRRHDGSRDLLVEAIHLLRQLLVDTLQVQVCSCDPSTIQDLAWLIGTRDKSLPTAGAAAHAKVASSAVDFAGM